jgi:XRCC1 N terminal domain
MSKAASVEVSSEDQNYPIESALLGDEKRGWRAAEPGSQTIRLIFDSPQRLRRIWLAFEDREAFRTQEVRSEMVFACRTAFPGNRASAVEF